MNNMTDEQIRVTLLCVMITWACMLVAGTPATIVLLLMWAGVLH